MAKPIVPLVLPGSASAAGPEFFSHLPYLNGLLRARCAYLFQMAKRKDVRQRVAASVPREALSPQELERLTKAAFGYGALSLVDASGALARSPLTVQLSGFPMADIPADAITITLGSSTRTLLAESLRRLGAPANVQQFRAVPPKGDLRSRRLTPDPLDGLLREALADRRHVLPIQATRLGHLSIRLTVAPPISPSTLQDSLPTETKKLEQLLTDWLQENVAQYDWLAEPLPRSG